jgi:hypothetical protein
MLLAYVDESGDPGKRQGATRTYTLGCVLVDADQWPRAFDDFLISLMVIHDEGDNAEVRRCLRRARRNLWTQEHYGGAYRPLPGLPLVDDPVPAASPTSAIRRETSCEL